MLFNIYTLYRMYFNLASTAHKAAIIWLADNKSGVTHCCWENAMFSQTSWQMIIAFNRNHGHWFTQFQQKNWLTNFSVWLYIHSSSKPSVWLKIRLHNDDDDETAKMIQIMITIVIMNCKMTTSYLYVSMLIVFTRMTDSSITTVIIPTARCQLYLHVSGTCQQFISLFVTTVNTVL